MKQKILICLLFVGLFLGLGLNALAANVWDWAWSENIGWIHFGDQSGSGEHWDLVNDPVGDPDDYDTYVWTDSATEEKDAYRLEDPPVGISGSINGIKLFTRYKGTIKNYLRLGGVESQFPGTGGAAGSGWGNHWTSWTPNRPGGGGWTWDDIRDLQVVIGLSTLDFFGSIQQGQLTQVYVEVEYDPGTGVQSLFLRPNAPGDYTNIANPVVTYGVNIDSTGTFSGHAWSENIGWISFNPSKPYPNCPATTCPAGSPDYSARVNLTTGKVTGWARACSVFPDNSCSGALRPDSERGGWDGWILLGPIVKDGTDHGVWIDSSLSPAEFKGWAWGGGYSGGNIGAGTIGWISFNRSNCDPDGDGQSNGLGACPSAGTPIANYKVMTDLAISVPPSADELNAGAIYGCGSSPIVRFSWTYSGSSSQSAYEIQIDDDSNLDESPLATLTGGADNSRDYVGLNYNTDYWWRLKVRDSDDQWSGRIYPSPLSFNTGSRWPEPDFDWDPSNPLAGQEVQFNNQTQYCGAGGCSWNWNFDDGNFSTAENPSHIFGTEGTYGVKLTATNVLGSCDRTKSVDVAVVAALPRPKWQEVAPTF